MEKMPEYIKLALEYHEVYPAQIRLSAKTDLSLDGEFCEVWLAVTDENLFVLTGSSKDQKLNLVSNAKHKHVKNPTGRKEAESWLEKDFTVYSLKEIDKLMIDNLVSTGLLTAVVDGQDISICGFTNSCARKVGTFVKLTEKIKNRETLTDEDFKEDSPENCCPKCGMMYPEQERKVCPKCMDKRSVFLRLLSFVPRYKIQISLILLFMFINIGLNLLNPYLGGSILFDEVLAKDGKYYGQVGGIVLVIVLARIVSQLVGIAYGRINAGMTAEVVFDLKTEIFAAMQRLSLSFYNKRQTGVLMNRVNHDADQLQNFFNNGFPYFIVNMVNILGIGTVMVLMNWKLALLVLIPTPFIVYYIRQAFPKLWKMYHRRYLKSSRLNSLINDSLKGVRVVKAFGKESSEIDRFTRANQGVFSVDISLGNITNTMFPIIGFMMGFGALIIWAYGGWQVAKGELTLGLFLTFINYIGMIYGPLDFMTRIVDWWSACMNSAQRIFEILDAVPDVTDAPNPVHMPSAKGNLTLRNVSFGYEPNKHVLHNINIDLKAGEMLGIVGHSGAGKSTLASLICRLYDTEEGAIFIDGINIRDIALKDLRAQIGIVSQETYLFMGTIAENIAYAKPNATMDEIVMAAKVAYAHEFIMKFPDGYNTMIGRGGRDLSGGERQRLSIARAILYNPKILILDEATSAIDTETEGHIQDALDKLVKGRTTLSIAHRLSTLRNADQLVVIEDGKIVESGTHAALIAQKGTYYRLVQKQSEALKMKGVGD